MSAAALAAWIVLALAGTAHAQDDAVARAFAAERAGDPATARAAWQEVADGAPGSRPAARARGRLAWLDARSEGGLEPLGALMRFQATAIDARDRETVLAFAEVVDRMPAGRVRCEARLAVGEDLVRVGEASRARETLEALLAEPHVTAPEQRAARDAIARAIAASGRPDEAIAYLEGEGLAGAATHEALERAALVRTTTPVALSLLAIYGVLGLALAARAIGRDGVAAIRAAYPIAGVVAALWIALGPGVLATIYDDEATDTFALLGAGTLAIAGLGALAARGVTGRARAGLAGLAAIAQLALAWLVLLRSGGLISFVGA